MDECDQLYMYLSLYIYLLRNLKDTRTFAKEFKGHEKEKSAGTYASCMLLIHIQY